MWRCTRYMLILHICLYMHVCLDAHLKYLHWKISMWEKSYLWKQSAHCACPYICTCDNILVLINLALIRKKTATVPSCFFFFCLYFVPITAAAEGAYLSSFKYDELKSKDKQKPDMDLSLYINTGRWASTFWTPGLMESSVLVLWWWFYFGCIVFESCRRVYVCMCAMPIM